MEEIGYNRIDIKMLYKMNKKAEIAIVGLDTKLDQHQQGNS